jgi:hypothetical protein
VLAGKVYRLEADIVDITRDIIRYRCKKSEEVTLYKPILVDIELVQQFSREELRKRGILRRRLMQRHAL